MSINDSKSTINLDNSINIWDLIEGGENEDYYEYQHTDIS